MDDKIKLAAALASLAILGLTVSGCATAPSTGLASTASDVATIEDPVLLGDNAARRGEYDEALTNYLLAISRQETPDPEVWYRVGAVCSHVGKTEQALRAFLTVVELAPEHAGAQEGAGLEYMALNAGDDAREHLLAATRLEPRRWRARNALGVLADRDGDHASAIAHYQQALAINTDSPMILNNIGYSRYLAGELDQAARDFYRVTELDSDYAPAWSNLGLVYARQGWYADAVSMLSRSLEKATAFNNVGFIALQNGDLADAEQLLGEAIRLSPTYYRAAYRNLDVVRARMRTDGTERGIRPESLGLTRINREPEAPAAVVHVVTAGEG